MTIPANGSPPLALSDEALHERVTNLTGDVSGLRNEIADVRSTMATKADVQAIQASIGALFDRQKPQPMLLVGVGSLIIAVMGFIGGIILWPVTNTMADQKMALISISDKAVFQRQYEADIALTRQNAATLRADLQTVNNTSVLVQRYNADKASRDEEIKGIRERIDKVLTKGEFESQHGDLKAFVASLMATRDRQLSEMTSRVIRLEDRALASAAH